MILAQPFVYRPGTSLVHRLSVAPKLLMLGVGSLAVTLLDSPPVDAAGVLAAVGLHVLAGLPWSVLRRSLIPVAWIVVPVVAYLSVLGQWRSALSSAADISALVVAASVVTATTSPAALLDTLDAGLGWLCRWRVVRRMVNPERVSLAISLTLAAIPAVARCVEDARVAATARGLERSVRARVAPAVIRSIGHAFRMADALTARGLGD